MKIYKVIGSFLVGTTVVYILVEAFVGIDPQQYHADFGNYSIHQPVNYPNPTASGTASIYPGTIPYTY